VGGALGLAIFTAIATARTDHLLAIGQSAPDALTSGFHRALFAAAIFVLAAALIALRTKNTRGEHPANEPIAAAPAPATSPAS
jgi:hypothetical protein